MTIPVSVIVVTKQEERRISSCLDALMMFDEILVLDSLSRDRTAAVASGKGVKVIDFIWNGQYPKKRQWALDNLELQHDWVFFVDADETVTPALADEIRDLFVHGPPAMDGYFVTGRYSVSCNGQADGYLLRHGIPNRKLALFHKKRMMFPVVDDLDIPGMGEIEGHYQPVARQGDRRIGSLRYFLIHHAMEDEQAWAFRHQKYARWEAGMNIKGGWPCDPVPWRQKIKIFLRGTKYRPWIIFCVSYFLYLGFLDGRAGLEFALRRFRYYSLIQQKQDELIQGIKK